MRKVERLEDMSERGKLRVIYQDDGDIIVAVQPMEDGLLLPGSSVEICIPGAGGGRSPRTHKALLDLMQAMAEDNADPACAARRPN